jgi:hypothetical protein
MPKIVACKLCGNPMRESLDIYCQQCRAKITLARRGMVCVRCLEKVRPVEVYRGSGWIELILWLFFLLPGIIYTIWRRSGKLRYCPKCQCSELVPFSSVRARQILGDAGWQEIQDFRAKTTKA